MEIKDYTTEQLMAELASRNDAGADVKSTRDLLNELNEKLDTIAGNTKPQITKESILGIKDTRERQRMMAEHLDLFRN